MGFTSLISFILLKHFFFSFKVKKSEVESNALFLYGSPKYFGLDQNCFGQKWLFFVVAKSNFQDFQNLVWLKKSKTCIRILWWNINFSSPPVTENLFLRAITRKLNLFNLHENKSTNKGSKLSRQNNIHFLSSNMSKNFWSIYYLHNFLGTFLKMWLKHFFKDFVILKKNLIISSNLRVFSRRYTNQILSEILPPKITISISSHLRVPEKSTGSWGIMVNRLRNADRPIRPIFSPSM